MVWIETELRLSPGVDASHVYVRAWAPGCFYSHISTRTFRRALTASLDSCAEIKSAAFSGVTKSGRVWRKVPESIWSCENWLTENHKLSVWPHELIEREIQFELKLLDVLHVCLKRMLYLCPWTKCKYDTSADMRSCRFIHLLSIPSHIMRW